MSESKRENQARILPFNKNVDMGNDQNVSEVTRNLFSDAWQTYLDQPSMAAMKLDSIVVADEEEGKIKRPKLTII